MLRRSRPIRSLSVVAAGTLALSATCFASSAASAAPSDSSASDPAVAAGVIYNSDGSAVGAGWAVTLTAEPNAATMKALAVGDTVPSKDVATATTAADGSYRLPLPPVADLTPFADVNGTVNLVVQSQAANEPHQYSFSIALPARLTAAAQARVATSSSAPQTINLQALAPARSKTMRVDTTASPQNGGAGCGPAVVVGTYANRHTQVGEAYTSTGASASFSYTSGASTTAGVGVATGGGAFSASGTSDTSSSSTQGFGGISGNKGIKWVTGFTVKKTKQSCNTGVGPYYRLFTSSFDAGNYSEDSKAFSSNSYCVPERSGDSFVTQDQNAYTFGGGLDVSSLIGIDLTAKTGWNSKTVVSFKFSKSMQLCGASGRPGGDARRLKATP